MAAPDALTSILIVIVALLCLAYLLYRLTVIRFSCRDLDEYDRFDGHDPAER